MGTLTLVPSDVVRRFVFVPDGHEQRRPETVFEALHRGHDVLQDEARWTQSVEHRNLNGADDPFCGNWRACAIGAVGLVTIGVVDRVAKAKANGNPAYQNSPDWGYCLNYKQEAGIDGDPDSQAFQLYRRACAALDVAAGGSIVNVNDSRGEYWSNKSHARADVLKHFKTAMRFAQAVEIHPGKHIYFADED